MLTCYSTYERGTARECGRLQDTCSPRLDHKNTNNVKISDCKIRKKKSTVKIHAVENHRSNGNIQLLTV